MNRRKFLGMMSGGLVASATMAEVGAWSEFLSWMRRNPVWSFPSARIATNSLFDEISSATLNHLRQVAIADNFFKDTSLLRKIMSNEQSTFSSKRLQQPFSFSGSH